jgi:hypothetical protein
MKCDPVALGPPTLTLPRGGRPKGSGGWRAIAIGNSSGQAILQPDAISPCHGRAMGRRTGERFRDVHGVAVMVGVSLLLSFAACAAVVVAGFLFHVGWSLYHPALGG